MALTNLGIALHTHRQRVLAIVAARVRIITGLSLTLFVLVGFWSTVQYGKPEVQLLVGLLTLSVFAFALLGMLQKHYGIGLPIAVLGLLIMVGNPILRLLYGYDNFEGHWYFAPIQIEYVTYAAVALVFAKRVHWTLGILASAIVYALNTIFTGSSWWWGYAFIAIMCGIAGTVLGLVYKRSNVHLIEEATLAIALLTILFLIFSYQMGGFY